jgi:hypothetical protein
MAQKSDVIAALAALEDSEGRLMADAVVDAARDPSSALHPCFEWDDTAAAHEHRLDQARRLIVSVKLEVTVNRVSIDVPFYIRDPQLAVRDQGYRQTLRIKNEEDVARESLVQEMARAGALLRRARHLAIVFGLAEQIEALEKQVAGFVAELQPEPEEAPAPAAAPRVRGRWRKSGRREARA